MNDMPIEVVLIEGAWWQDVSIIISILAIMISLFSVGWSIFQHIANTKSVETEYFFNIAEKILAEDLPVARRHLIFDINGCLSSDYMKLTDVITELRKKIQFFYFQDQSFYREIDKSLIDLDEAIIVMADKKKVELKEQQVFFVGVDNQIAKVYKKLLGRHAGK